jgi:hypothetical protein
MTSESGNADGCLDRNNSRCELLVPQNTARAPNRIEHKDDSISLLT